MIEDIIPRAEIDWDAAQLLCLGLDVVVETPPKLIVAMRVQTDAIATLYRD